MMILVLMQEEGWPLGLGLLNGRIGLVRNSEFSGSISLSRISTMLSSSSIHSTDSSSYLDTEVSNFIAMGKYQTNVNHWPTFL